MPPTPAVAREYSSVDITSASFWRQPFASRDAVFAQLRAGAGGPALLSGYQLAKTELRQLFRELLTRLRHVEFGEADLLYSTFVHGIKRLPAVVP